MKFILKSGTDTSGFRGHEGRPGRVGGSVARSSNYTEEQRARNREAQRRYWERQRARELDVSQSPVVAAAPSPKYNIAEIFASMPDYIDDNEVSIDGDLERIQFLYPMVTRDMLKRFFYVQGLRAEVEVGSYGIVARWYPIGLDRGPATMNQSIDFSGVKVFDFSYLAAVDKNEKRGMPLVIKQVAMCKLIGANNVKMFADITIGKYAWAKEGVDYLDSDAPLQVRSTFRSWCRHMKAYHAIDIPPQPQIESYTKPYQFASLKVSGIKIPYTHIDNEHIDPGDYDVGKAFMLDSAGHGSWYSIIDLKSLPV